MSAATQSNGSITRDLFRQKAQPVTVTVNGTPLIAEAKELRNSRPAPWAGTAAASSRSRSTASK